MSEAARLIDANAEVAETVVTAPARKSDSIGYILAATGAILFSIKAVIVKLAYGLSVDPETLLALRMGFSLPFYLGIGFHAIAGRRHKLAALPCLRLARACARPSSACSGCGSRAIPIFLACNISPRNSSG